MVFRLHTVLADGFETESTDGCRVAPFLGDCRSAESGVLRLRTLPNFWCHASCDHAVLTRLLPDGLQYDPGARDLAVDARAGRVGLPARRVAAVLATCVRAGLAAVRTGPTRRQLDGVPAGAALAPSGIQSPCLPALVSSQDGAFHTNLTPENPSRDHSPSDSGRHVDRSSCFRAGRTAYPLVEQ